MRGYDLNPNCPAVIARAATAGDVAAALAFARATGLRVAVRAGGHSVAGYSSIDGGLVIDLTRMKRIDIDAQTRRARVQPGVTAGEFDRAAQAHGLATTGGRMTTTGVAGFTLGSGSGWLERLHGPACDNLLSAQVVIADGRVITASETENPELLWGLRGGGGNFGVVTEFEFALHPVGPTIYGGMLLYPRDQAPEVCRNFRDFLRNAPREIHGGAILMTAPPAPFVPPDLQGRPAVAVFAMYFGDLADGPQALSGLHGFGNPAVDLIGPTPYLQIQALTDNGNPPGRRNYWRSEIIGDMSDEAIDALIACAASVTSPFSVVIMAPLGGAIGDVPENATALSGRSAKWMYHCYGSWQDTADDERGIAWVRATGNVMHPWTAPGVPLNFNTEIDSARVQATFGTKHQRLVALKDQYDPDNLFQRNQNIAPSRHPRDGQMS
jgi:FAD/FMN-containing dehydrogenase